MKAPSRPFAARAEARQAAAALAKKRRNDVKQAHEVVTEALSAFPDDCLRHVLSFLAERDLYHLEDAWPIRVRQVSAPQWKRFSKEQHKRNGRFNTAWRPRASAIEEKYRAAEAQATQAAGHRKTLRQERRLSGRDFVRHSMLAEKLANEAELIYDFDKKPEGDTTPSGASQRPAHTIHLKGSVASHDYDHNQWKHWRVDSLEGRVMKTLRAENGVGSETDSHQGPYVFLRLSLRDGTSRCWEGFREVSAVRKLSSAHKNGAWLLKFDLKRLIREMGWVELEDLCKSWDDSFPWRCSLAMTRAMKMLQVTIVSAGKLVLATGGCQRVSVVQRPRGRIAEVTGFCHKRFADGPFVSTGVWHNEHVVVIKPIIAKNLLILGMCSRFQPDTPGQHADTSV